MNSRDIFLVKIYFFKKVFPSLFDLNRSLNSKFFFFLNPRKKSLKKNISFFDFDHFFSEKKISKHVNDPD
jgi:hypothetical protein